MTIEFEGFEALIGLVLLIFAFAGVFFILHKMKRNSDCFSNLLPTFEVEIKVTKEWEVEYTCPKIDGKAQMLAWFRTLKSKDGYYIAKSESGLNSDDYRVVHLPYKSFRFDRSFGYLEITRL